MSVLFLNVNFKGNDQLSSSLSKMNDAAKKLSDGIKDTQKDLAALNKIQLKTERFEKLKQTTSEAQKKLESYKKTAESLKQQLEAGGKNSELANQLKAIEKEASKLQNTVERNTPTLKKMRQELNDAGLGGMSLADAQRKLKADMDATNASIDKQRQLLGKINQAQEHYDTMKGYSDKAFAVAGWTSKALLAGGAAVSVPVNIAINAEKSMADVAKVVDGLKIDGKVTAEYHKMEREITDLSNRLGMSFSELTQIISGGAQGGIAKNELLRYGESAVKIGIAWDLAAEKVGQSMAELRSSFGLSQEGVEKLADQINYLGNNSTSAAPFLLDVVQYSGAIAKAANLGAESVAAMAAATSGIDSSTLGTGIKNIAYAMTAGENATKSQREAWKQLGFTSEQVAKRMQIDAEGMYLDTLEALRKLPEEQRLAMAATIYGREAMPVVSQHLNNPEQLKQYLKDVKDLEKIQNSVNKEYESATTTTAFKMQKARVQIQNLGKDFGAHLLPIVGKFADKIGEVATKLSEWAKANPDKMEWIAQATVGIGALLAAITVIAGIVGVVVMPFAWLNLMLVKATGGALTLGGALKAILTPISSIKALWAKIVASKFAGSVVSGLTKILPMLNPMRAIPAILTAVKGGFIAAAGAAKSFVLALFTNPITGVIAAIAVAALLIYKFWNPIKAFFAGIWDSIKAAAAPIMPIFEAIGNAIKPALDWLGEFFSLTQVGEGNARSLGQTVGGFLVGAFMALTAPMRLVWSVAKWLWDGLTGLFSGEISIGDIFAGIKRKFEEFVNKIKEWKDKAVKLWDDFWSSFKSKDTPSAGAGGGGDGGGFWSSLVGGFESAKTKISETAGGLWDSAKSKFDEAKGSLATKASEIWSSVTQAINGGSGVNITATISAMMSGVIGTISTAVSTISSVLSSLVSSIGTAMSAVPSIVGVAFGAIPAIVSMVFGGLVAIVAGSMTNIISVIGSTMSAVPTIVGIAFSALPVIVATAVSSLPAIIASALSSLPAMMAGVFATLGAATLVGMMAVTRAVTTGMVQVVNAVRTGFGRVRATISSMWRSMGSAMSGNPILSRLQAAMNQALGYLNGVKGRFVAIGADISAGLARGIQSNIGQVQAAAAQLARAAESAARVASDTHSPSRKMMAVGGDMVAGLDVGLRQGFAPTLKNWTANIGTLHQPISTPPIRATRPIMRGGGTGISHSYTGGAINITINAPAGSDQRSIAREVANELKKYERAQAAKRRASYTDYE